MKALVGKSMLMKNKNKRGTSLNTPLFHIYFLATQGNLRELRKTQGNSGELEGTQGNSKKLKRTQWNSREL